MPLKKNERIIKLLKDTVSIVIGKQSENIIDFLGGDKYVNEFIIAKKLDITINQARNILYKLSDHGMVSSIRKKDKRKGWYTYFWKIEIIKILDFSREHLKRRIDQVIHQIESREIKRFYICERCNIEYNEENALYHDFICNECGSIFVLRDNTKIVKELRKNLERQNKELVAVEEERSIEREKTEKRKIREFKKEEIEKKQKRAEKRLKLKKIKEKEEKKLEKIKKVKTKKPGKKKIISKKPKKIKKKPGKIKKTKKKTKKR